MASLAPALRKKLEDAVKEARDVAEAGARAALEQLAVHAAEPFAHLSPEDRELRNRLRARARQLGDGRDTRTGAHQIDHLVVECAYEHWHRMLFARFLAENGVLMANSEALGIENTPVTLEECEELAADEGAANGWELAGRYASKMLPQIFRPDAPVLAVHLPPERQRRLEQILAELAAETFKASDALGWVYQFWQAKKKDEVNASGVKIGADELPAVTQLFTEPYMVEFLLHNTLGAWWAGKVLAARPELAANARSEEELRDACALPGYSWTYLRFLQGDSGWSPAAGTFNAWPAKLAELRFLDPCCGSGHFLVAAFEALYRMRAAEDGLKADAAAYAVVRDNLYGLEIDERCTQLAAFSLALAAWQVAPNVEPKPNIACSGLAPNARASDWMSLAGESQALRNGLEQLHAQFSDAAVLGSLIDPTSVGLSGDQRQLGVASFEELEPLMDSALGSRSHDAQLREMGVTARGIASAARVLTRKYHLIATNVPYLGRGLQCDRLQAEADRRFPASKADLCTMFLDRFRTLSTRGGTVAVVTPQNWWFLAGYERFRTELLRTESLQMAAALGEEAWQTFGNRGPRTVLVIYSAAAPTTDRSFAAVDASSGYRSGFIGFGEKPGVLAGGELLGLSQAAQFSHPGHRILLGALDSGPPLSNFVDSAEGLSTGDNPRFSRSWWEVRDTARWKRYAGADEQSRPWGGRTDVIDWQGGDGALARSAQARIQGLDLWGREGVLIGRIRGIRASLYDGDAFDKACVVMSPKDRSEESLLALYAFLSSTEFEQSVRTLDQKVAASTAAVASVPFDIDKWTTLSRTMFPSGLPARSSNDATQWLFDGALASATAPLQVAVASLLGFRWPEQEASTSTDLTDDDGIVCLPSVRGEEPAAERVLGVLAASLGPEWTPKWRDAALAAVDAKGKGLDWWLQNKFFEQHSQLFQHRPFIWHIWDGIKKDGFGALVNYHKLDRKLLETLTYTYLGDWIRRQQDDAARNVDGASERLDAARRLQQSLELILEGEKPHDIFVRWKPLHEQPIGWEPDLNDGVRVNIRPFMSVPDVDKKGAGVLRYKPNIHWKKDRGSDPDDAPWFELGPTYGEPKGARINDHHLSLAEKRAARERAGGR